MHRVMRLVDVAEGEAPARPAVLCGPPEEAGEQREKIFDRLLVLEWCVCVCVCVGGWVCVWVCG
jgi:hypothetical protein